MLSWRVTPLLVLAVLLWQQPAGAQTAREDEFTTKYFGTTVSFHLPAAIDDGDNYWGARLPDELFDYDLLASLAGRVRGTAIDPLAVNVQLGEWIDDHGATYSFSFDDFSPAEVRAVLEHFGTLYSLFPGAQLSFEPLLHRYYSFNAANAETPLSITGAGFDLLLPPGQGAARLYPQLLEAARRQYGPAARVPSLSYSEDVYEDGGGWRYVGFEIDLRPAETYDDAEVVDGEDFM